MSDSTVLNDDTVIRLCLDDGATCVLASGEILNCNAASPKLDDIIAYIQSLPSMMNVPLTITAVTSERIEILLEILSAATQQIKEEDKTVLSQELDALTQAAIDADATDIHILIEPSVTQYFIRVDGRREILDKFADGQSALRQGRQKGLRLATYIFGTKGGTDINERDPANDKLSVELQWMGQRKTFEWRSALMPIDGGIKVTLRLLTQRDTPLLLSDMKLPVSYQNFIQYAVNQRSGGILISGPMGSGKTSTIYAAIETVDKIANCIHSLEDPVEIKQPFVHKTTVEPNKELVLNSGHYRDYAFYAIELLRQDVNKTVIGEMRNFFTAKEFCRIAETGGIAIGSVHASSALGSVQTLIAQLGVSAAIVSAPGLIRLLIHQRLVRRLCPHCSLSYDLALKNEKSASCAKQLAILLPNALETVRIKSLSGCEKCRRKGEKGRLLLMEMIVVDDADRHFMAKEDYLGWQAHLELKKWPNLRDHALSRIAHGEIDLASTAEQINDLIPVSSINVYQQMRAELGL